MLVMPARAGFRGGPRPPPGSAQFHLAQYHLDPVIAPIRGLGQPGCASAHLGRAAVEAGRDSALAA